jgi:hypothetical protein
MASTKANKDDLIVIDMIDEDREEQSNPSEP